MAEYAYKAKQSSGKTISGEIKAESKDRAKRLLQNRGLRVVSIKTANSAGLQSSSGIGRFIYKDKTGAIQIRLSEGLPSTRDLAVFTKQFSLMIERGVPMLQSLSILKNQQKSEKLSEVIQMIASDIEQGSTLSDAIESHPKVFDQLYVAMIKAGEASGKIDVILRQLVIYIEKAARIKAQVKSAMMYPVIIVVVAFVVVTFLLVAVVPTFAEQFSSSGGELPGPTQLVLDMSDWLVANFLNVIIAIALGMFAFFRWIKSEKGRAKFDAFILKAPIIGDVLTKIAIGRFCSTMAIMLGSGVSILEALQICGASSGNKTIENFVVGVRSEISQGKSFSEPIMNAELFPGMVASMIAVGESTGALDETLSKVTEIYDEEVDQSIETMTSMIEPIMIVTIGCTVGFIVIAMYLPIFDMAKTMN